jgi:hypothetical protein
LNTGSWPLAERESDVSTETFNAISRVPVQFFHDRSRNRSSRSHGHTNRDANGDTERRTTDLDADFYADHHADGYTEPRTADFDAVGHAEHDRTAAPDADFYADHHADGHADHHADVHADGHAVQHRIDYGYADLDTVSGG